MSWVIELLQENYGWKQYLRRFETKVEAEAEAKNFFKLRYSVKNYKVRELTPEQEEGYEQRNFIT